MMLADTKGTLPRLHLVDGQIAGTNHFVVRGVERSGVVVVVARILENHAVFPIDRKDGQIRLILFNVESGYSSERLDIPVLRNLPEPFDAGVLVALVAREGEF